MNYRLAQPKDAEQIRDLCLVNKIAIPQVGILFVAEQDDRIVGVIGMRAETIIEPLISTNPIAANTLFSMCEGVALSNGVREITCRVADNKTQIIELCEKVGFEITDPHFTILKKQL
jgi:hypothetical protein